LFNLLRGNDHIDLHDCSTDPRILPFERLQVPGRSAAFRGVPHAESPSSAAPVAPRRMKPVPKYLSWNKL
jgi:hypothetical protein